jgi:hypothetical protein
MGRTIPPIRVLTAQRSRRIAARIQFQPHGTFDLSWSKMVKMSKRNVLWPVLQCPIKKKTARKNDNIEVSD